MIRAEELRIGNYILFKQFSKGKGKIGQMKPGDFSRVACDDPEDSEYHPILLNHEWLERCGFTKDNDRYDGETVIACLGCIELHHDEDQPLTGYSIAIRDDGNHAFVGYDIRYLHQLQNLYFALTGKNIKINSAV